jgi:hypothetical protein
VEAAVSPVPDDVAALKARLFAATRRADEAEARLANARARESATEAMIAHLKLQIAKLKREAYGASAERSKRLLAQMELQLEDLEADASEDELVTEAAAAKALTVTPFERKRPSRKPFPDHLPRERVVVPAPCSCPAYDHLRLCLPTRARLDDLIRLGRRLAKAETAKFGRNGQFSVRLATSNPGLKRAMTCTPSEFEGDG